MSTARRALVTGGNRGIGLAIAALLRAQGHEVIAPTRDEVDLSSPASVQDYLKRLSFQPDILVNNAGLNKINPLDTLPLEDWQAVINTNLTAPFLLTQAVAGPMKERRWGRIVNISSCYSKVTRAGRMAYTASKSGLNGLTQSAAVELAPFNVLVNAVCPGFVETDMTRQNNNPAQIEALRLQVPLGRLAQPGEIAEFVAFLVSDRNTYLTGECIPVDGGFLCQ
jgi:3-oxoacyl-[acyl-carrier protein] reductase